MRIALLRVILAVGGVLALAGCGDDPEPDPVPTATTAATPTATGPAEATATTTQSAETPEPDPFPPGLTPVGRTMPLAETGAYLLDTETLELWRGGSGEWSPDGTALASRACCLGDGEGVRVTEVRSGTYVQVPADGDVTSVTWSPDSQQLAAVVITPGVTDPTSERALFLLNRDGSDFRQVATIDAERPWLDVRWVNDETLLAVHESAELTPPDRTYFRIDVTTGVVAQLSISDPPAPEDPRILTGERSPDGKAVAYLADGLHLWNAATGTSDLIDATGRGAQWSPDSRQLLFVAEREGEGHPFSRLLDVASGITTDLPEVGMWAQWLADGRIVHSGWRCPSGSQSGITGSMDVSIFSPHAGAAEALTNTPHVSEPEGGVSPRGDRLAYFAAGDPYTLELVDLASGTGETVVAAGAPGEPFHVHDGGWSPDGRYLQFTYGFAHGVCD